jgi:ubiquinone/menaquinone biosynthesis C-methylase UbiE
MELWKPSWTYLASSPSPSYSQRERGAQRVFRLPHFRWLQLLRRNFQWHLRQLRCLLLPDGIVVPAGTWWIGPFVPDRTGPLGPKRQRSRIADVSGSPTAAWSIRQNDAVVDRAFSETSLAELYDLLNPWGRADDDEFYLDLVMDADSVLDVGCGTGQVLRRAREVGHTGRLCGLDPAEAMLDRARSRADVEWILGELSSVSWDHEFDLIVMTGHAFQVFVDDADLRASLAAIRAAVTDGGRFAFETRNPLARAWEGWTPDRSVEVVNAAGAVVRVAREVQTPVEGDVVRFATTYMSPSWDRPQVSRSTLRFLDARSLSSFLADSGWAIDAQFGDWARHPLTDTSPEIITIARPV